ncbi:MULTISPECIES: extracellular solute-binding protein [unclassified Rathayibacter]|uniref:ABC transporter substrate-binding protein n=1 Tax=unclassified Rathayibacter TaxID=2609250 RepID=UPI000F97AA96|nr:MULTISPECIES: extracellular solute-binding protein [unclassified Rathayibacter]MCJ1704506.1 extracellular solute-binding protein [Rathayibacter sp. VKM Ac-2926]ROQ55990.1 raffinose/stachyose/melibiose transport system substrate-binding protein [Rathayibacter sp. PhB152]ROS25324.1 raffinose/stachyose/melibiose transport system substrate-binding protein [Rathayibacter sp. PhB127]TCL81369.1 raffinose/stachyose/melibiose transport system substrate-binding protein [Rathayibacter sp. PhB192]TCM26
MSLRPRTAFHRPSAATVGSLSRRGLIAGGVGIGAMFALAACSGGGSDAGSDALATDVDGAGRTLTMWDFETPDSDRGIAWLAARDIFTKETGAEIAYEFKAFEQLRTGASQIFNSNSAPDVVEYNKGNATSGLLSSQGLLTNLDEAVEFYGWDKLIPGALQTTAKYDDKGIMGSGSWYGIPNYGEFTFVYYNKDVFAANGLEVPTTYDEFTAVLDAFVAKGITPLAEAGAEYPLQQLFYQLALLKADRQWITDYQTYTGEVDFEDAAWSYAADQLQTYVDKGYFSADASGLKAEDAGTAFISGEYPIFFSGSWWFGRFKTEITGFEWDTFLFPGAEFTMGSAGNHWVIPETAKNKDLAYKWIDITMRPEIQNLIGNNGGIPLVVDETAITDEKSKALLSQWKTVVDEDQLSFYPDWPTATFYDDLVAASQELINGSVDPSGMLTELQGKYDDGVADIK